MANRKPNKEQFWIVVYRPSHDCPDDMYGGTVRCYGESAYLHE